MDFSESCNGFWATDSTKGLETASSTTTNNTTTLPKVPQYPDISKYDEILKDYKEMYKLDSIPQSCRSCNNHPSNGGSGICHCILGQQPLCW